MASTNDYAKAFNAIQLRLRKVYGPEALLALKCSYYTQIVCLKVFNSPDEFLNVYDAYGNIVSFEHQCYTNAYITALDNERKTAWVKTAIAHNAGGLYYIGQDLHKRWLLEKHDTLESLCIEHDIGMAE